MSCGAPVSNNGYAWPQYVQPKQFWPPQDTCGCCCGSPGDLYQYGPNEAQPWQSYFQYPVSPAYFQPPFDGVNGTPFTPGFPQRESTQPVEAKLEPPAEPVEAPWYEQLESRLREVAEGGEQEYLDHFDPLREDLQAGADEIAERHEAIEGDRVDSREAYARGEHGLGQEFLNQAWNDLKENLGNAGTAIQTFGEGAYDVLVEAPVRVLRNAAEAVAPVAAETVLPIVEHIGDGIQEIEDRHTQIEQDRQESREAYADGEHGIVEETLNQAWNDVKETAGDIGTVVTTTVQVAVDVVTAPARFILNGVQSLFGG
ncbi:MAG: hypothetical protein HYU64_03370 [Armatimonadetes bacterium]|nr:hypothetical protein [Armatimonadota bacterium]